MDQRQIEEMRTTCPIARQAVLNPNGIAIQADSCQLTYLQLHQVIDSLAVQLSEYKMKKGDRLVSIAKNGIPQVLLQLTCLRYAFIFCPINPQFSHAEKEQRLKVVDTPFIYQENNSGHLGLNFSIPSEQILVNSPFNLDPLDIVSIIFTSGSSGTPKAVMHNFSNHVYSALGSQTVIPLIKGDINLLSLPIFHISGYATVMRTMIAGATLHISSQKLSVTQLNSAKVTHLSLVSTQLQQLLKEQNFQSHLSPIKHLLLGGSAFPSTLLTEVGKRGFVYHLSYGSTEMASQIATSTNSETLHLLPYRALKVVNDEILLSGETRFVGYFTGGKQSKLNANKGYFPSSDLGELKGKKDQKTLKVIGRKDRQFISGGENIQPEEIEKILLSFAYVAQVHVLPIEDPTYGHCPIAFVKWVNDPQPSKLQEFIEDKLIAFKRPKHFFLMPEQQGIKTNFEQLSHIAQQLLARNSLKRTKTK